MVCILLRELWLSVELDSTLVRLFTFVNVLFDVHNFFKGGWLSFSFEDDASLMVCESPSIMLFIHVVLGKNSDTRLVTLRMKDWKLIKFWKLAPKIYGKLSNARHSNHTWTRMVETRDARNSHPETMWLGALLNRREKTWGNWQNTEAKTSQTQRQKSGLGEPEHYCEPRVSNATGHKY